MQSDACTPGLLHHLTPSSARLMSSSQPSGARVESCLPPALPCEFSVDDCNQASEVIGGSS